MIGYVRDGFRIHPHLVKSLADPKRHKSLGEPTNRRYFSRLQRKRSACTSNTPSTTVPMEGNRSARHFYHALSFMA